MISKADFLFIIGYEGETALVDGALKRRFGRLDTRALAEAGLYRAAVCSALYEDNREDLEAVRGIVSGRAQRKFDSVEQMLRVFGISEVPAGIKKVKIL